MPCYACKAVCGPLQCWSCVQLFNVTVFGLTTMDLNYGLDFQLILVDVLQNCRDLALTHFQNLFDSRILAIGEICRVSPSKVMCVVVLGITVPTFADAISQCATESLGQQAFKRFQVVRHEIDDLSDRMHRTRHR